MTIRRALVAAALLAACARGPAVTLRDAYAFQPVLGDVGAVYFTIENRSSVPDTLRAVAVGGASVAMLHEQVVVEGREEMRHLGELPVPARSEVVLRPGGLHLMVEGFSTAPVAGDTLVVTATLARAGVLTIRAPVRAYGEEP